MFTQSRLAPSSLVRIARVLAAILVVAVAGACASMGRFPGIEARPSIAFENAGNEPVRVYLVESDGGDYLLGNVYPMERASLRVPPHMTLSESRQLTLVVVPLSRYAGATLKPDRSMQSPTVGSLLEIANFRWIATPGSLHYERGRNVSTVR